MALGHLHHFSGMERSPSPCHWAEGVSEPERLRGGGWLACWLASSGAEEKDSPGLQFVSSKQVLNLISPFD